MSGSFAMRVYSSPRADPPRPGAVTPVAVLSVALLVGVIALVVDGGSLMEQRRHVQAAADAAALAAAADLFANYAANQGVDSTGTAVASAQATAQANGFSNDGVQSVVTVTCSPHTYQGGANIGKAIPAGYVEVIIQYNAGRMFSNVFGSGDVPVRARAVARGQWGPVNYAVMALSLTVQPSNTSNVNLNIQGNIWINSTAAVPIPDPLRFLPVPDPVQLGLPARNAQNINGSSVVNLYPGMYNGGINASGNATVILHANTDGTPGIYYLTGGSLNVSGNATVTTAAGEAGVMIYNNAQGGGSGDDWDDWDDWDDGGSANGINVGDNGHLVLAPPASGPYQGVSIFQARGTPATSGPQIVLGGNSANVLGTIYAPYANVFLGSHPGGGIVGQVISDTLSLVVDGSNAIGGGTGPLANMRTLGLAE